MIRLEEVRKALRRTSPVFDEEIELLIAACQRDLTQAGIEKGEEDNPLFTLAVILYVKAYFGNGDENGKFQKQYENLKLLLRESGESHV